MDIDYRKEWDHLVLKLDYVERDEKEKIDIIHWEMQWPRMFSNRDYCFARRHTVNKEDGAMVIMNKYVPIRHKYLRTSLYQTVPKHLTVQYCAPGLSLTKMSRNTVEPFVSKSTGV